MPSATFAARLRSSLDAAGISAASLASLLGVHRSAITHWLAGRHTPSVEHLEKMAARFGWPEREWHQWAPDFAWLRGQARGDHEKTLLGLVSILTPDEYASLLPVVERHVAGLLTARADRTSGHQTA